MKNFKKVWEQAKFITKKVEKTIKNESKNNAIWQIVDVKLIKRPLKNRFKLSALL